MPTQSDNTKQLRARLAEAEETLRAIRMGEVDTVMVPGKLGPQVFTLKGEEHAYRVLIESMNEGALTLTAAGVILYANQCFARMVKCPLEQVTGSSFYHLLPPSDQAALRLLLKRTVKSGSKMQAPLLAHDGMQLPTHLSIRPLARNSYKNATFGIVVTDMTESQRNEAMLRTLTHRVVQAQENERRLVALELHDNITQRLCSALTRWQALANKLPVSAKSPRAELRALSDMLGETVEEVQRISRNLRPSILDELGLVPALRAACAEFVDRTGLSLKLVSKAMTAWLPAEAELALYRIHQKALENIEKHARAHHVIVSLTKQGDMVQLVIKDDGIGFDPAKPPSRRTEQHDFGLLRMRERATYAGGSLSIKSVRRVGTEIMARIPLRSGLLTAKGVHP